MAIFREKSKLPKNGAGQTEADENLGLAALTYIIADEEIASRFFAETGLGPDSLAEAAQSPGFFGFILEFICSSDEFVLGLAAQHNLRPETIVAAQARLAGPRTWESI